MLPVFHLRYKVEQVTVEDLHFRSPFLDLEMGNLQSQTFQQISDSYFKMVTNITASAVATYSGEKAQINNATVNICLLQQCGRPCSASFSVIQTNDLQETLDIEALSKVTADVKNNIVSKTVTWAQGSDSSTQGWLSTAFSVQIQNTDQVTKVAETIATYISDDTTTVCSDFTFEENNVVVNACGTLTEPILVGQSNATRSATSCIAKQVLNAFVSNSEFASGIQKADLQAKSEEGGLFGWIEYIAAAICLVIIIFLIIHLAIHLTGGYKPKPQFPPGTIIRTLPDGRQVPVIPGRTPGQTMGARGGPSPTTGARAPTGVRAPAGAGTRPPMPLPAGARPVAHPSPARK